MDRDGEVVSGDDDDTECRICRGDAEIGPLLHPCKCAGSIRYVHQECLDAWLSRTNSVTCELCHQPFVFSPVYAPNAPEILSAPEFVIGVVNIGAKKLVLVLRVMAVIFLWVLCLPVGTSWISRLYFLRSLNDLFRFKKRLQLGALVSDWMQGVLLSLLVVTVFLAVSGLRDYMLRQERQQQQQQENRNHAQNQDEANPDAIPHNRQNDEALEEVAMGNWGDDELPADLPDFNAALPLAGAIHDEVTEVEGDQLGQEDLGELYNVDAVDQDLLRQRHLLQLQQRLRQQQGEAEAVQADAQDEAMAMAAAVEEEEQRRQLEMHADNDDMMLGFLDAREEEVS